jgi:NAD-dependent histone deacetylase SIR2
MKKELGLACPEDLFDIMAFVDDPRPFYKFASRNNLYSGTSSASPTPSHIFLSKLDETRRLLRVYTQNIDALEVRAGVSPEKVVYAHGTLSDMRCMECGAGYDAADVSADVVVGRVPHCRRPGKGRRKRKRKEDGTTRSREDSSVAIKGTGRTEECPASAVAVAVATRQSTRLRTSSSSSSSSSATVPSIRDDDGSYRMEPGMCGGVIRPNVTFFGERLDDGVGRRLREDALVADALVVMGTSLSV